jgi:hypothetical protein
LRFRLSEEQFPTDRNAAPPEALLVWNVNQNGNYIRTTAHKLGLPLSREGDEYVAQNPFSHSRIIHSSHSCGWVPGRRAFLYDCVQGEDKETCSNASLHGSYGLHATGTSSASTDFAAVGRFTFDGKGNLTGKLFVRIGGNNIEPPAFSGTYSVNPDCTMTDSWGAPINSTHVSVIVDEGKGYFILSDTPGSGETISAEARRQ